MIKDNINHIDEIMWHDVLVTLFHYKNTNGRLQIKGETNGSHFKLPEEVFSMVTSIDNKEDEEDKTEYKAKINI